MAANPFDRLASRMDTITINRLGREVVICTFFAGRNTDDDGEEFDILNVNHTSVMVDLVVTVQDFLAEVDGLKQQVAALMAGS